MMSLKAEKKERGSLHLPSFRRLLQRDSSGAPSISKRVASASTTPHGRGRGGGGYGGSFSSTGSSEQSWSGAESSGGSAVSHLSRSTLLDVSGLGASASASYKPKSEKARSLLRFLMRTQKTSEESVSELSLAIRKLIPCGDVVGLLAVSVKNCKDFTPKFNVKHDTNLLVRISIDKIMKCTNPQVYKANHKTHKSNIVHFGDIRYFSVKVPKQKSDPRNRILLELVGFENKRDFPRLFGNVTLHLYEVIQKQSFVDTFAVRIRNMVFCTIEVEFMFCYGCLGYGYSHQLRFPDSDPAKAVAYSMFMRVPPPDDRRDQSSNVTKPQRMDYPAFLSPDLNVPVGNLDLPIPTENIEYYQSLQKVLKEPPRLSLEKMKQEYRSLKTWRAKADYLDQLILKRGPKSKHGQIKVSRFREIVGKIHRPLVHEMSSEIAGPRRIHEIPSEAPTKSVVSDEMARLVSVEPSTALLPREEIYPETESEEAPKPEPENKIKRVPTLTVTSSTTTSQLSPDGTEILERTVTREEIYHESESSLSSSGGIVVEYSDSQTEVIDSESIALEAFQLKATDETLHILEKKESIVEQPPELLQESATDVSAGVSEVVTAPTPLDFVAEALQPWPRKEIEFQQAVFSGNKFEPFLRHVCKVPPPTLKSQASVFSHLEKKYSSADIKEQEDQDPPHGKSLTKANRLSDTKLIKSGEQLSILRLIESKMEVEQGVQPLAMPIPDEPKPLAGKLSFSATQLAEGLSEELQQAHATSSEKLVENVLINSLTKIIALKSLLSTNIENLVEKRLSEAEKYQEAKDNSLQNTDSSLDGREKSLQEGRKSRGAEMLSEAGLRNLKAVASQNLQARLMGKLSRQGIIPDMEITETDRKVSLQISGDMRKKSLPKDRISQGEIPTLKSLSESLSENIYKAETMLSSKKSSKECQSIITETDLCKSKIENEVSVPPKSQSSSREEINTETESRNEQPNKSLEIIRVMLPSSPETELTQKSQGDDIKQQLAEADVGSSPSKTVRDSLIEKCLQEEITNLKSLLSKGIQDHLKETLPDTGLSAKEGLEKICRMWSSVPLEKDLPEPGQVSSKEVLADICAIKKKAVLSESIQNFVLEPLSDSEITTLKSVLNKKTQEHLLRRLSEIGLITERVLRKILKNLFLMVDKEPPLKEIKESDLPKEKEMIHSAASLTQSLQDRFSEEELNNLKSLLSRLSEGHKDKLSESDVKGLTSVLEKSFESLPVQSSCETGISQEVEVKDKCITLPSIEERTNTVVAERGKDRSKESLSKISSATEKHVLRGDSVDFSVNGFPEVDTREKETQTNHFAFPPKKVKYSAKKESHKLQDYPDKPDIQSSKRGFETVLKNKQAEEPLKEIEEPFACSSFLSAHDIGVQSEVKNFLPKPTFPVNPQTFLFLHSESEEETKSGSRHQKTKSRKKSDRSSKKDATSPHCSQPAVTNAQVRKERTTGGSKEHVKEKGRRHCEPASPKLNMTEARKDSKTMVSPSGVRKECLKQKSEKKRESEVKPKKSSTKTAAPPDPQQQTPTRYLAEKSSGTKLPSAWRTKGNILNPTGAEDLEAETFKHLQKAIERALLDLGKAPEGSPSQAFHSARPNTAPGAAITSKESSKLFSTTAENPRYPTGSITKMLDNQEHILKMTPEQLEVVLRILQNILRQNTRS